ncbi:MULTISPECIES: phosphoglycerate kinase [Erythrobacteraceae]|jgi:phosphoglycerate kinase|uniref:Phosphoglycerate kinase n=2 Tax=Erythrobacteraceae TaxID=335929 RepID=A0A7G6VYQ6_9SPHN|nr:MULTISPECIES: phosphoglycerate kinase [Erythrobacteraceae]MDP4540493.1 phosphoglycerate kinase [Qipengyuania sp. DY56-A-20]QNE06871.1 phosphoglycerate kinase [Croceicoccus marinus]|tara:strand:- start:24169 stop:25383 length:1215 start_codon:yes stop_codon:yes gene_type:complete
MVGPSSASSLRTLDDISFGGKTAIVRVDLNVPVEDGVVADATRIERIIPTLRELIAKDAKVVLLSHLGRPKGKVVADMSLEPVAGALEKAMGRPVRFVATNWRDGHAREAVKAAAPGDLLLMENTRFHPGEETNDPELVAQFANLGDIYVNDAFSSAHRAHASTEGIAHVLPAVAGRALQAEIESLSLALENPDRPVFALVGGAKVSTKLDLLVNLVAKMQAIGIGGTMANTFLAAQDRPIGRSMAEREMLDNAREVIHRANEAGCTIFLPIDVVVATEFSAGAVSRTVSVERVGADEMILDVGPATVALLEKALKHMRTVVWNGPVGAFEVPPFDQGTVALAGAIADLADAGRLRAVAGGGDTAAALNHAGVADRFSYVSSAGGAFLEWLEGKALPGVVALRR